jgi:Icc-related predicted phosphoesterase
MKFVCISDTHGLHNKMLHPVPDGDVLLIAGDFTNMGELSNIKSFNKWLGNLPHKHKVLIAGNHDLSFERDETYALSYLPNITHYLNQSSATIDGINIYGEPRQPEFHSWAFNVPRDKMRDVCWRKVPKDTHILLTHGPPYMYGDYVWEVDRYGEPYQRRCGCMEQQDLVEDAKRTPNLFAVVCGHIHDGHGIHQISNRGIKVYNAAICNEAYKPVNKPLVFEI